jgi:hypothetical protein
LVKPPFAAPDPFEMLDGVSHIHLIAGYTGFRESLVKHPSGRSNERKTLAVFLVPRLLADEDHFGMRRTFTENRLSGVLIEIAAFAVCGSFSERFRGELLGQKITRRLTLRPRPFHFNFYFYCRFRLSKSGLSPSISRTLVFECFKEAETGVSKVVMRLALLRVFVFNSTRNPETRDGN